MTTLRETVVGLCVEATIKAWRDYDKWLGVGTAAVLRRSEFQSMPENAMQLSLAQMLYTRIPEVAYVTLEEQVNRMIAPSDTKGGRKVDVVGWDSKRRPIVLIEAKRGSAGSKLGSQLTDIAEVCRKHVPKPLVLGVICQRVMDGEKAKKTFENGKHHHSLAFCTIPVEHQNLATARGGTLAVGVCSPKRPA